MAELYDRQKNVPITVPEKVTILGVGGVGTWMGFALALAGVKEITLIDYDAIEEHNLNRTPYRPYDVGFPKVDALSAIIGELRPQCRVTTLRKRVEQLTETEMASVNETVVIDCRDNLAHPGANLKTPLLKAGYDGTKGTIYLHPTYTGIIGEANGYTTVPSWVGTPLELVGICLHIICDQKHLESTEERIVSFDARETFEALHEYAMAQMRKSHV